MYPGKQDCPNAQHPILYNIFFYYPNCCIRLG